MVQAAERTLAEIRELVGPLGREPASGIYDLLRNPSDEFEMDVDGGTPVRFAWTNELAAGRDAYIRRILLVAIGGAVENQAGFFSLAALSVGIMIDVRDEEGTVVQDFDTVAAPIKRHAEFGLHAGVDVVSATGAGTSRYGIRWTLTEGTERPQKLHPGWSVGLTIRDDIQTLTMFRGAVQGFR